MATLRDLRAQLGMTQQQLADALGVGLRTVKGYEGADDAPRMAVLACERLLSLRVPANAEQPGDFRERVLDIIENVLPANLEARLNALEAAARPRQPRFAPDVQALQDRMDADLEARRLAKLAELEAQEADQATVVPMNPYRPAPLTPAEEAARKARRAAAKAAHIANGEPWDE